jgi:predicted kinase
MKMPKCYQLVGVPASGKSTWINNQDWASECVVVSTDEFVEAYAIEVGSTYSEVFKDYMPTAVRQMADKVVCAREAGKDIIWDQTSTGVKARARKFNMLPDYEHIAVVFKTPESEELARRLASRPGKEIPWDVVQYMITNWEEPTEEEGFKEIWFAS